MRVATKISFVPISNKRLEKRCLSAILTVSRKLVILFRTT
jgi:hypothetical protein